MFSGPSSRVVAVSARSFHRGVARTHVPALLSGSCHATSRCSVGPELSQLRGSHQAQSLGYATAKAACVQIPQAWSGGRRQFTAVKKRGTKKKQVKIDPEEEEAFEQDRLIREQLMEKKDIQDWEFDEPSQFAKFVAPKDMPPTPILDAYEMSRDPEEMERLIKMAFDSLPERAGPRRNNHRRRQHQKFRMIRNIKYKEKAQRMAAYERKLQKSRDLKAREAALFATWRTPKAKVAAAPSSEDRSI